MNEKPLSEKESLDLIAGMIGQAKNHYYESGSSALLWGFTNVICFVLAYFKFTNQGFSFPFNPFWLMLVAGGLQIYFHKREKRFRGAVTFSDEALVYVWSAFGISIFILTIVGGMSQIGYVTLPMILTLFAIPTFICGCIKKFTSMTIGGIVCWILSIICFLYKSNEAFLMVALGALFAWVIPGIILRQNFNKSRNRV